MIPKDPAKTITLSKGTTDNPRKIILTDKEWDAYKVARGQTAYNELNELMTNEYYLNASDEEKAAMVEEVWKHAEIVGKQAVAPDYKPKDTFGDNPIASIVDSRKEKLKDNTVKELNTELLKAVKAQDATAFDTMIQALHDNGVEDKTIKEKIAKEGGYRDAYKAAYLADDIDKMYEIEDILDMTGFDYDYKSWRKDADKKNDK